jgi:PAS domain S-box-containing protein
MSPTLSPTLSPDPQVRKYQILIVEDEQVIAINLRESLESMGYSVPAIAASAPKAIEYATHYRPHLVLMDIQLKGKPDGIEAAEKIWQTLQIPIIYVTGHSDQSTVDRANATAPFGYILKPIREKELCIALETALQRYEREQLLVISLEGMGNGVIVADAQKRVKFINGIATALTEWTQADASEQALSEVLNLTDQHSHELVTDRLIHLALAQNIAICPDHPLTLTSRQGNLISVSNTIAAIRNAHHDVIGVVVVVQDITKRPLHQTTDHLQAMAQPVDDLHRLNRLKETFLATISHELRTPLSNTQLATRMLSVVLEQFGMLARESESSSTALNRYIKILQEQSEREVRLVNDLLELQRLNAETYPVDLTLVQLQHWMPHMIEPFIDQAQTQQKKLQVEIAANLPTFQTDTHVLTRIVSELLQNACKYTPPNADIRITVEMLQLQTSLPHVHIEVCNSGVEIAADELSRVFDPFYRIPQRDCWGQGGTGLGLALVKKFAMHLGGSVVANSQDNQTCFSVYLPMHPPNSLA